VGVNWPRAKSLAAAPARSIGLARLPGWRNRSARCSGLRLLRFLHDNHSVNLLPETRSGTVVHPAHVVRAVRQSRRQRDTELDRAGQQPARNAAMSPAEQRRALAMLAGAGMNGVTEATLLAHGFTRAALAVFVRKGLARARRETVMEGRKAIDVYHVRITTAGRRALEG
jgi:hypothetical protein